MKEYENIKKEDLTQYRSDKSSARFWEGEQPRLICFAALIWAVSGSAQFWPWSETLIASANCIWNSSSKKLKLLPFGLSFSEEIVVSGKSDGEDVEVSVWDGVARGEGLSAGGLAWWWWSPIWSFRKKCFTFDISVASHRSGKKLDRLTDNLPKCTEEEQKIRRTTLGFLPYWL